MKIDISHIFIAWVAFSSSAFCNFNQSLDPQNWPEYVLKFKEEGTLKDVFDAGLRPYRYPGLEKSSLGFKHVRVVMELKTGERLPPIAAEWGDISPLEGGLLSDFEITSPDLSIDDAEGVMTQFLSKGNRTKIELQSFLKRAASDPIDYDDPRSGNPDKFGISWEDVNGPKYAIYFKKTFNASKPVSFALNARWTTNHRSMRELSSFYKIPIPPPPGYESVSMDAPRNFGPDSAVEIARSKGLPITGDRTPEEYEKQWRLSQQKSGSSNLENQSVVLEKKDGRTRAVWIVLIGLGGAIIFVISLRRWKSRSMTL